MKLHRSTLLHVEIVNMLEGIIRYAPKGLHKRSSYYHSFIRDRCDTSYATLSFAFLKDSVTSDAIYNLQTSDQINPHSCIGPSSFGVVANGMSIGIDCQARRSQHWHDQGLYTRENSEGDVGPTIPT